MHTKPKKGFCALEAILASGALAALSVLCMQLVAQSLTLKTMLLCRQEAELILTQYKSAFEVSKRLPKNANGSFSNGTPFALTVTSDTMLPFLQKAVFEMQWAIVNKEFSETLNGVICKWN